MTAHTLVAMADQLRHAQRLRDANPNSPLAIRQAAEAERVYDAARTKFKIVPSIIDNSRKPCIAVDFDGTVCDHAYPECGAPKKDVSAALTALRALGFQILIYSCRTCHWHCDLFEVSPDIPTLERPTVIKMRRFLEAHNIPYDEIDDGSKGKPLAAYYIDDRAREYSDNWEEIVARITKEVRGA